MDSACHVRGVMREDDKVHVKGRGSKHGEVRRVLSKVRLKHA